MEEMVEQRVLIYSSGFDFTFAEWFAKIFESKFYSNTLCWGKSATKGLLLQVGSKSH